VQALRNRLLSVVDTNPLIKSEAKCPELAEGHTKLCGVYIYLNAKIKVCTQVVQIIYKKDLKDIERELEEDILLRTNQLKFYFQKNVTVGAKH